jgi:hypothetical protein
MKILHAIIYKGNTEDLVHKTGKTKVKSNWSSSQRVLVRLNQF